MPDEKFAELRELRATQPELVTVRAADRRRRPLLGADGRMMIIAADHPARGALSAGGDSAAMANRYDLLRRLLIALDRPGVDGLLATADLIEDLLLLGALEDKVVFGSMNRGGLQGASFELDDRFTAYDSPTIASMGLDGGKMLVRIDPADPATAPTLEAAGRVVTELGSRKLVAMLEPFMSTRKNGRVVNDLSAEAVIRSVAIASGLGAISSYSWLKLPVIDDMERVMAATTLPTVLLGGDPDGPPEQTYARWAAALALPGVRGFVIGRALLYPKDGDVAGAVDMAASLVHGVGRGAGGGRGPLGEAGPGGGWHWAAGSTRSGGELVVVTAEGAGWGFAGLRVVGLEAGGSYRCDTGADEVLVLPLSGSCSVDSSAGRAELTGRESVFSQVSDCAYVPVRSELTVTSAGGGRFALASARAERALPFSYLAAADVPVELRGAGACSRQVNNFGVPGVLKADRLIACEVLTPAGNWSSYPPHKHDEDRPGESALEEIYYYEVTAGPSGPGLAYQRVYGTAGRPADLLAEVRDGDVVLIPHGWHGPAMAAPGYDLYYLNVMAGPGRREWLICDDPAHSWVRSTWPAQPADPRLPMTSADPAREEQP